MRRELPEPDLELLYDPQTSGGLFFAVDPSVGDAPEKAFRKADEPLWLVGEAVAGESGGIEIV